MNINLDYTLFIMITLCRYSIRCNTIIQLPYISKNEFKNSFCVHTKNCFYSFSTTHVTQKWRENVKKKWCKIRFRIWNQFLQQIMSSLWAWRGKIKYSYTSIEFSSQEEHKHNEKKYLLINSLTDSALFSFIFFKSTFVVQRRF